MCPGALCFSPQILCAAQKKRPFHLFFSDSRHPTMLSVAESFMASPAAKAASAVLHRLMMRRVASTALGLTLN